MKKFSLFPFAAVMLTAILITVAGCTEGVVTKSGPDKLMENMIASMNDIADAVEAGKSDAHIEKLQAKFESARSKFAALPAKEQTLPSTKYFRQLQSAQARMAKSVISHSLNKVKSMQGQYGN